MPVRSPLDALIRGVGRSVVVLILAASFAAGSMARAAENNRILTMTKDALYGGATGLLLGGVLTLVVDSHHRDDVLRWGVVVGTFAGFGYGVYEVSHGAEEFSFRGIQARRAGISASEIAAAMTGAETRDGAWARMPVPEARALGRSSQAGLPGAAGVSRSKLIAQSTGGMGGLHAN
jgi:hypothetical protein